MQGSSTASTETVVGKVEEVVAAGADPVMLGAQLFALTHVLDTQPGLRRVLTDPSIDDDRLAELVEGLLHDFDDATVQVAAAATRQRWSAGRDLGDAVERGGVTAFLLAADAEHQLDEVEDELFRFARIVRADPHLGEALGDRTAPTQARQQLVDDLLQDQVGVSSLHLVRQAVVGRHRSVLASLGEMQRLAAARRERLVAEVRVASPLSDELHDRLATRLAQMFDHELQLNVVVDPDVLGGVTVSVGDHVVDGTVSTRLAEAHRRLAS